MLRLLHVDYWYYSPYNICYVCLENVLSACGAEEGRRREWKAPEGHGNGTNLFFTGQVLYSHCAKIDLSGSSTTFPLLVILSIPC